jgi:hypothetical protein
MLCKEAYLREGTVTSARAFGSFVKAVRSLLLRNTFKVGTYFPGFSLKGPSYTYS